MFEVILDPNGGSQAPLSSPTYSFFSLGRIKYSDLVFFIFDSFIHSYVNMYIHIYYILYIYIW